MRSPIFAVIALILGGLTFPKGQPEIHHWEYPIPTQLNQEEAFQRLAPWIEDHYLYSHREYLWDGESRVIAVRQGVGMAEGREDRLIQYRYTMNIRVENRQIELLFLDMEPLAALQDGVKLNRFHRNRNDEYRWIQQDLLALGENLEGLLE